MSQRDFVQIIELGGKMFYNTEFVKQSCPAFFYGCAKTLRKIVEKKNIKNDEYVYATYAPKTNKWSLSNDSIKSAKLLLEKTWVENNVPSFGNNNIKLDLEMAPPILELKDEEKFKDDKGNIVEIETRGIKTFNGIYFYGKDVEKMLELVSIKDVLHCSTSSYKEVIHYKNFIRKEDNDLKSKNNQQTIYLTYMGLVKLIQSTRKNVPIKFTDWLHNLLGIPFTHIKFISAETDTIESIQKSICSDSFKQYSVDKYRIDLYFPEYNLAIECDENNHKDRDINYEIDREIYIKDKLKCSFIRYNPYSEHFDIFKVIREINNYITQYKINENNMIKKYLEKQQIKHEYEIKENKREYESKLREYELKLKHEQELKNIETQSKAELTKILMNLSINFNKH